MRFESQFQREVSHQLRALSPSMPQITAHAWAAEEFQRQWNHGRPRSLPSTRFSIVQNYLLFAPLRRFINYEVCRASLNKQYKTSYRSDIIRRVTSSHRLCLSVSFTRCQQFICSGDIELNREFKLLFVTHGGSPWRKSRTIASSAQPRVSALSYDF